MFKNGEFILKETNSASTKELTEDVTVEFDDTSGVSPMPLFVTTTTLTKRSGMKSSDTLESMLLALEKIFALEKMGRAIEAQPLSSSKFSKPLVPS